MGKTNTAKTPLGDFKVTTPEIPLLSQQVVTSKGIPVTIIKIPLLKSRTGIRATVSHVLGSRASERETVTIEQVQLGIGVRVQL